MNRLLVSAVLCCACSAVPLGDPDSSLEPHGFSSEQVTLLRSAANEWNSRAGCGLTVVDSSGNVQVTAHHWDSNVSGQTRERFGVFSIELDPDVPSERAFRETALHELGHLLTGPEHSENPDDVMFPEYTGQLELTGADIARFWTR